MGLHNYASNIHFCVERLNQDLWWNFFRFLHSFNFIIIFSGSSSVPQPSVTDLPAIQEQDILDLGEKYRAEGKAQEMSNLIKQVYFKKTLRIFYYYYNIGCFFNIYFVGASFPQIAFEGKGS